MINTIKNFRKLAGLSQVELANKMGVSQSTVAMWETNKAMPSADKLPDIAKILNCKIDDLLCSSE